MKLNPNSILILKERKVKQHRPLLIHYIKKTNKLCHVASLMGPEDKVSGVDERWLTQNFRPATDREIIKFLTYYPTA